MIVVTATLLFALLFFAPIRFRVSVRINYAQLSLEISVKTSAIRVFDETLTFAGRYLHCEGTVSTDVDLTQMNRQTGVDLLKCITIDKVAVSLANNVLGVAVTTVLFENVLSALAMSTLCNISHCQLYMQVVGTFEQSYALVDVVATTSVAELSFCLLKQEVKLWKTRISEKL